MNIIKRFKKVLNSLRDPIVPDVEPGQDVSFTSKEADMANTQTIDPFQSPPPSIAEVNIPVPEIMIQQAAMAVGGENSFTRLLMAGEAFRAANLTPVFLTNKRQTALRVTAEEYRTTPNIIN